MQKEKQKGITLVALVVTIVVLLILAAVSINLVLGENGLISNAKEAREKSKNATEEENYLVNGAIPDYIAEQVNGKTGNAKTITADDYGKVVTNYQDGHTWEIFYADNTNVYLITRDNVGSQVLTTTGYHGISDFDGSDSFKTKYPAIQAGWLNKIYTPSESGAGTVIYSGNGMNTTEYLLDSSVWNTTYKTENAEWAIGGPTYEMLVASYNKKYVDKPVTLGTPDNYGYGNPFSENNSLPASDGVTSGIVKSNIYNHGYNYWIACSSCPASTNVRDRL